MDHSNIGDRMKAYEIIPKIKLMKRTPVAVRLRWEGISYFYERVSETFR